MNGRGIPAWLKLAICLVVCVGIGFVGSIFTQSSVSTWFSTLNKPPFSPPNWLFAPVWTILYILMGISAFLIWRLSIRQPGVKKSLVIFVVQLILNLLWSVAFFGLRSPLGGLIVIIILWIAIILTMLNFWEISKTASLILIPYILWVSFAAVLNFSIYVLNL